MGKFNLDEYETVKSRKEKFYKQFTKGSIVVELLNLDTISTHAVFKASVFETKEDQMSNLPRGVGYALEVRDKEMKISNSGAEYESVNFTSWTENCEESAVGRALDNAGFSGSKKPSREEMIKVEKHSEVLNKTGTITREPVNAIDTGLESKCLPHNTPMFQEVSPKTGEPYWSHKTIDGKRCFGKVQR